jgi:hypothetical protein
MTRVGALVRFMLYATTLRAVILVIPVMRLSHMDRMVEGRIISVIFWVSSSTSLYYVCSRGTT